MKNYFIAGCLLLSGQTALLGCATCISLAEKKPKLPKNEVYVQLKKKKKKKKKSKKTNKKATPSDKKE